MSDARVIALLERLDVAPVPARPDQQEELWALLEERLEAPSWRRLLAPRRVLVAAGVAALVLVVAGMLWFTWARRASEPAPIIEDPPATEQAPERTALSTVLEARERWTDAPRPFHAIATTVRSADDGPDTSRQEIWFASERSWRTTTDETSVTGTTSYTYVWDGQRELSLWPTGVDGGPSAQLVTYLRGGEHVWGSPLGWTGQELGRWWEQVCGQGELLPTAQVLGRPVASVRCGPEELVIDTETGLVLRHTWPAGPDRSAGSMELTTLTYDPTFDAALFDTTPPSGIPLLEQDEISALRPGQPAPDLAGRTLDGAPYPLPPPPGEPTLVVLWSAGVFDLGPLEQFHRDHPGRLRIIAATGSSDEAVAGDLAERLGYTVPIVVTDDIWEAWDPPQASFWVLFDAQGRVAGVNSGLLAPTELDDWLGEHGV